MTPGPFIIKVCGITNEQDAAEAVQAGANALGFNFYEGSPRFILPERAGEIIETLPPGVLAVGVFVHANEANLLAVTAQARLDVIQLHGDSSAVAASEGRRIWKSIPVRGALPEPERSIELYLLDSFTPEHGGSGETFAWEVAKGFPHPFVVAGGLHGGNVADAIAVLQPAGVDACSRLEASPGKKDPHRVRAFVESALQASRAMRPQEVNL